MNARPEPGILIKGMLAFIERSPNDMCNRPETHRYVEVAVVAVGDKLVTATTLDGNKSWRVLRTTLRQNTQYSGDNVTLVTPEQRAWDIKERRDAAYLREQGITLSVSSPWATRRQELADLMRGAE